jgi:hypothetical protein
MQQLLLDAELEDFAEGSKIVVGLPRWKRGRTFGQECQHVDGKAVLRHKRCSDKWKAQQFCYIHIAATA